MIGDRHIIDPTDVHYWMPRCRHCGKAFKARGSMKYGSNACRQAAYRKRIASFLPPRRSPASLTFVKPKTKVRIRSSAQRSSAKRSIRIKRSPPAPSRNKAKGVAQ